MARYRVRTAAGEVFDVEGMAAITRHHPGATITHTIEFDSLGTGVAIPYEGEQPAPGHDPEPETGEAGEKDSGAVSGSENAPAARNRSRSKG